MSAILGADIEAKVEVAVSAGSVPTARRSASSGMQAINTHTAPEPQNVIVIAWSPTSNWSLPASHGGDVPLLLRIGNSGSDIVVIAPATTH